MGWAKFDDQFTDHPKVVAAGPWAELLAMRAVIHCARYETDGHVQAAQLPRLAVGIVGPRKQVAALVAAGLWTVDPDGDGWWVHDFLDYHPSRTQKREDREIAKRRYAMNNNPELAKRIKARDDNRCRYCGVQVNWRDRKSPGGGTYDHVIPVSAGGDESDDNLVVSCRACNLRKGARTPEEAGMELRPPPGASGTNARSSLDVSGHPDPAPAPSATPLPPQAGESDPRNPRAKGTNPRAVAAREREAEERERRRARVVGTPEYEAAQAAERAERERLAGSS